MGLPGNGLQCKGHALIMSADLHSVWSALKNKALTKKAFEITSLKTHFMKISVRYRNHEPCVTKLMAK